MSAQVPQPPFGQRNETVHGRPACSPPTLGEPAEDGGRTSWKPAPQPFHEFPGGGRRWREAVTKCLARGAGERAEAHVAEVVAASVSELAKVPG